jgi:hypothetical protein
MGAINKFTCVVLAAASLGAAASIANAVGSREPGDGHAIVLTERSGDVAITANGREHSAGAGSTLAVPSRVATGADGFVALVQDQTRISIAPQSDVEIPADAAEGHLVARLVQHSGNVFYDVQKREAGRLRVETPFLVAVIKGTQFNVAVQGDSTTISLFEGRLEIRTPDDDEVIQLNAGEIAIRSMIDDSIRVIGMNDQALELPGVNDAARVAAARDAVESAATLVAGSAEIAPTTAPDVRAGTATSPTLSVRQISDLRVTALAVDSTSTLGGSADIGAGTDLGGTKVGVDTSFGAATLDVAADTRLDLGDSGPALDTQLDTGATLLGGTATVDAGLDTGVDLTGSGLVVDADADVGLGGTGLDTSVDASVDLGSGTVDASLGLGDTSIEVVLSPETGLDVDTGIEVVDDLTDGLLDEGGLLGGGSDTDDSGGSDGGSGGGLGGLLGGLL